MDEDYKPASGGPAKGMGAGGPPKYQRKVPKETRAERSIRNKAAHQAKIQKAMERARQG